MIKARNTYNNLIISKEYLYEQLQTRQLETLRFKNVTEYWKMLKDTCVQNKVRSVNTNNSSIYFKSINDHDSVFFSI